MTLYRPVGEVEYRQIAASGNRRFPPRGEQQPIFHLILQQSFAEEIAQAWWEQEICHIVCCYIDDAYISAFPVQNVGDKHRRELWLPSEEVPIFNDHILGEITLVKTIRPEKRDLHEQSTQPRKAAFV
ncbi:MAG: hypothetical protein IJY85_04930 [Ruminococcus sp.]|nr:hypothetical protein [Ruminococcus sp.]